MRLCTHACVCLRALFLSSFKCRSLPFGLWKSCNLQSESCQIRLCVRAVSLIKGAITLSSKWEVDTTNCFREVSVFLIMYLQSGLALDYFICNEKTYYGINEYWLFLWIGTRTKFARQTPLVWIVANKRNCQKSNHGNAIEYNWSLSSVKTGLYQFFPSLFLCLCSCMAAIHSAAIKGRD